MGLLSEQLSVENITRLDHFLKVHQKMSFIELYGFLTGVISSPYFIAPNEWIEMAGLSDLVFEDKKQKIFVIETLMATFSSIAKYLDRGTFDPCILLEEMWLNRVSEQGEENENENKEGKRSDDVLARWSYHYVEGLCLDEEIWSLWGEEEEREEIVLLLMLIMSRFLGDQDLRAAGISEPEEMRRVGKELFSEIINGIYDFYSGLREMIIDEDIDEDIDEEVDEENDRRWHHVGRNEPCPCGSGKKYKKCCLNRGK